MDNGELAEQLEEIKAELTAVTNDRDIFARHLRGSCMTPLCECAGWKD
jgi:hypothetical protein